MATERAETPLDSYLVSIEPSPSSQRDIKPSTRPNPKTITLQDVVKDIKEKPAIEGGISEYNRAIKRTLGKEDNPVTNSTSYSRTMHVQSCATGHQGGGGAGGKWTLHRNAKLRLQAAEKQSESLKGVIGYISGYTGNEVTNTQLKACVERQGGQMVTMANGRCTHIFITSNLSGSKAEKYLESNKKNKFKLVLPSWAFECEKLGKRVSESRFIAPIKHEAQTSAFEIYASKQTPSTSLTASTSASNLLSAPPTIASPRKRSKLPRTDSSASSSEELIILSPSPSPNTKSHRSAKKSPIKKKMKVSLVKEREKKEKGKEKKVEELLVLGSSDVKLEDPSMVGKARRPEKKGGEKRAEKKESEEEEELDEFGMPPSGQRR